MIARHVALEHGLPPPLLKLRARPLRIALVGNPNVGKIVVFDRMTGRYVTVSNYSGTTVAVITERVLATDGADLVVQVADARNVLRCTGEFLAIG